MNQTSSSFRVECQPGFNGGLHQVFLMMLSQPGKNIANFTNGTPSFSVSILSGYMEAS